MYPTISVFYTSDLNCTAFISLQMLLSGHINPLLFFMKAKLFFDFTNFVSFFFSYLIAVCSSI